MDGFTGAEPCSAEFVIHVGPELYPPIMQFLFFCRFTSTKLKVSHTRKVLQRQSTNIIDFSNKKKSIQIFPGPTKSCG